MTACSPDAMMIVPCHILSVVLTVHDAASNFPFKHRKHFGDTVLLWLQAVL